MLASFFREIRSSPVKLFSAGWCVVLLALVLGIGTPWNTFLITWKIEFVASLVLIGACAYFLKKGLQADLISREELLFIIAPVVALILWSAISAFYASSWKAALHHTLLWSEYLLFYLVLRSFLRQAGAYHTLLVPILTALVIVFVPMIGAYIGVLVFGGENQVGIKFARYGEIINTITPLALFGILRTRGKRFAIGVGVLTALWLIIFCSFGRINNILFLGSMLVVIGAVFVFKRLHEYRARMAIVVACFVVAPLLVQAFSLFSERTDVPIVQRLSDQQSLNNSNNFRKLMIALSLDMFRANPVVGIGADNFGLAVNDYRAAHGRIDPDDPNLAIAEAEIPERTHNEYLQILAELGIVGAAIFGWFLLGIGLMFYRLIQLRPRSPFPYAAMLGIAAFLVSSGVSSYSFRMMQNGMVFFFVLAVASRLLMRNAKGAENSPVVTPRVWRPAFGLGILACIALAALSLARGASVGLTYQMMTEPSVEDAQRTFELASMLDDENPFAPNAFGMRLFVEKRYADAVPYLSEATRLGRATSADLSYLATAQRLAGDVRGAQQTFAYAAELYPRSTFVLTRYAAVLRENGDQALADKMLARAIEINPSTANSWRVFIDEGPTRVSELAARDEDYAKVMDLSPPSAIYALKAERDILYPEQVANFNFGKRTSAAPEPGSSK
jgi:O-antigen ligase/Tfp pilus assembly protein PilF